jgi:hypothetical protein
VTQPAAAAAAARDDVRPNHWLIPWDAWGGNTTSGSGTVLPSGFGLDLQTGATAGSRAQRFMGTGLAANFVSGPGQSIFRVDWSKRVTLGFALAYLSTTADGQFYLRYARNASTSGALTHRGIGVRINNTTLVAQCHDGTTLNTSGTLATVSASGHVATWVVMQSDGAGNVAVYIDGTLATTMTGGPTSIDSDSANIVAEVLNNGDASSVRIAVSPIKIHVSP